jgi:hypothetical protein
MDHKFFSKAYVNEYGKGLRNDEDINLGLEILSFGISRGNRILHVGACDTGLNLIDEMHNLDLETFYLGIDVKDQIQELQEEYKDIPTYAFKQKSIQDFIDDEMSQPHTANVFDYTLLTGVFNKPIYAEQHYLFISTIIDRCIKFSDKVIFTLDESSFGNFSYSVLYVINNIISAYNSVTIKKLKKNNYIFCITH